MASPGFGPLANAALVVAPASGKMSEFAPKPTTNLANDGGLAFLFWNLA
jgi:hypothetical protein